jgi:hypothetical protein
MAVVIQKIEIKNKRDNELEIGYKIERRQT